MQKSIDLAEAPTLAIAASSNRTERNVHLDVLRGLAIIIVVGVHAFCYAGVQSETDRAKVLTIWTAISTMAVPAFFLCDGFLFALTEQRPSGRGYAATLARSVRRLLWPWLVFTLVYTGARAAAEAAGLFGNRLVLGRGPLEIAGEWWEAKIAMQLYFLPALFLIRCLGPVLLPLASSPPLASVTAALLWIVIYFRLGVVLGSDPATQALSGLRFYLLGIALCRYHKWIHPHPMTVLAVSGVLMLALAPRRYSPEFGLAYQLAYLIAAHSASMVLDRRAACLAWLGRQTMGVYLLHAPPVMKAAQMVVLHFAFGWLDRFLAIWAISFLVALGLTRLVSRFVCGRVLLGVW